MHRKANTKSGTNFNPGLVLISLSETVPEGINKTSDHK